MIVNCENLTIASYYLQQELYKQIDANFKELTQQNEQKIQEIIALLQKQAQNRGITFKKAKNILTGTISNVTGNVNIGDINNIQNANLTPLYIVLGFVLILVLGLLFKDSIFKGKNNVVQSIDTVQTQPQDTSEVPGGNTDTIPDDKPKPEDSIPPVIPAKLSISLTTNKGTKPVFNENDEVKIFYSVSKPAYVRIIYQMADGSAVLLADNIKVDAQNINKKIKTPYDFVCAEPFGTENMVAYAQSEPFEPLQTEEKYGYEFITQTIYSAYEQSEKGLRKKIEFAKNEIKVTTKTK